MREEVKKKLMASNNRYIVCELPTGMGKTSLALHYAAEKGYTKLLILIPKKVLEKNWLDEVSKWGYDGKFDISFSTYVSISKQDMKAYDLVIADEAHRFSAANQASIELCMPKRMLMLSATIGYNMRSWMSRIFKATFITVSLNAAIDGEVLPEPKLELIPLNIEQVAGMFIYKRGKEPMEYTVDFSQRNKYKFDKKAGITCTAKQYLEMLEEDITYFESRKNEAQQLMFAYLRRCKDRLEFLAKMKVSVVKQILSINANERTIVFAPDVSNSLLVCENSINSKDGKAEQVLTDFNEGRIKHISSCRMLDEGVNLVDCKAAVFMAITSSDVTQLQRIGRVLRHKEPVVYIPYFVNTREETIIKQISNKLQ